MPRTQRLISAFILAALTSAIDPPTASAQSDDPFFQGKTINLIVYSDAGSSYDIYARVLAKHMPNHKIGRAHV